MSRAPVDFITLQSLQIAQTVVGEGQPLLLLHGWGANMDLLLPLGEKMSRLGYCVYMLDMPGFGQSQEPTVAWTVFDYATFIVDFLRYHQLEKVDVFGHSFGGRLGLILGSDYSPFVRKLVLADSAGIRPKLPLTTHIRTQTYKSIRQGLDAIGAKNLSNTLRQIYNTRYGSSDFNAVSGIMRQTFIQVINQDLQDYAKRVKPATLLFWGDQDEDTPLWMGQALEKLIPDAGLVVHRGAGHYSYLDRLDDTVRTMDYFFKN